MSMGVWVGRLSERQCGATVRVYRAAIEFVALPWRTRDSCSRLCA